MKNEQYINIQGWMINELGLADTQLILYAIVYGFSQDGKSRFTGGLKYLESCTNKSKSAVKNNLIKLVDAECLIKYPKLVNGVLFNEYAHNPAKLNFNVTPRGYFNPTPEVDSTPPPEVDSTPNNTTNDNTKKINDVDTPATEFENDLPAWANTAAQSKAAAEAAKKEITFLSPDSLLKFLEAENLITRLDNSVKAYQTLKQGDKSKFIEEFCQRNGVDKTYKSRNDLWKHLLNSLKFYKPTTQQPAGNFKAVGFR